MSIFNDKALKSVADAVSKVLEQTEPKNEKEKKLAAMAHPKDKITHKDVLVGRGVLKKEEVEQLDELDKKTLGSYIKKATNDVAAKGAATRQFANDSEAARKKEDYQTARKSMEKADKTFAKSWARRQNIGKAVDRLTKEDVEQVEDEMLQEGFADMDAYMKSKSGPKSSGGAGIKQGHRYGGGKQAPDVEDDEEEKKPARGKYGARQNFKRSVKEGFTGLINAYSHGGLKELSENLYVEEEILEEEPDNEQFTKELKDQEASMAGTKKQPSVAAPATQGVKQMPEEVQIDDVNQLDERTLTPDEKSEMEKNVKGMKKKLSGFKDRYGDRAKSVMYATATKMAKKD